MSVPSLRMRSAALLARIIGLLSLILALGGCSAIKLGYNALPALSDWWLDGYLDFDDAQRAAVRDDLARIHAWHRATELPRYAQLLQQFERLAPGDITPEQACGFEPQLRARLGALVARIEPAVTEHALSLRPEQIAHLERKYQQRNRDYQREWVRLAPEELVDKRLKEFAERIELVYGDLGDAQRALLRRQLQTSNYSAATVLAERRRRQQDTLATLRRIAAQPTNIAEARAAVHALMQRTVEPPEASFRAYIDAMRQETCRLTALVHNSMSPSQREHAAQRLRGWQHDLADLAAPP
ncbi:MAG: DUF6279 family lipoprotein [Ramlibacter sp.]